MINFAHMLNNSKQQVNTVLRHYFQVFANLDRQVPLIQAMHYSTLSGGKRLRPFLVYQIGQLFGFKTSSLNAAAAAIECIHAYSLIHDDLPAMDNDTLRRGLPACHLKFNERTAILAGDALQTLAFTILAEAEMPEVSLKDRLRMISTLASASGASGMCLGQALDLEGKQEKISAAQLEMIYRYKTGALIRAAVQMGVLAAGEYGKSVLRYLDHFADSIGLAFQIQNDILDIIGKSQTTGKRPGVDKILGKITYPALLGLDTALVKVQDLYHESLTSLECVTALGYDTSTLIALAHYIIKRDK